MNDKSEWLDKLLIPLMTGVDLSDMPPGVAVTMPSIALAEAKATLLKAFREVEIEGRIDELNKMREDYARWTDTEDNGHSWRGSDIVQDFNNRIAELTKIKEKL